MTSPIQGMVATIINLKHLQLAQDAQDLAERQFGLSQAATTDQVTTGLRALASSLPDPKVLLPHVQTIAQRTGLPEDLVNTIFSSAAPNVSATRDRAVAQGAAQVGGALDVPAAYAGVVGEQPGGLASDALTQTLMRGAQDYLGKAPPDQQQSFHAGLLTRVAKGQTMGEALNDELFAALPKDEQSLAVQIGKGLAPSAQDIVQNRLGAAGLKIRENELAATSAYQQLQVSAALAEARSKLSGQQQERAIEVLKSIQNQQQFLSKNSGTFTPEGQIQQSAALNALYDELKKIDPEIGGIFQPIDTKTGLTATSPFGAFFQKLRQQP